MIAVLLAQVPDDFYTDRTSGNANCIQQNKVCPGWAIDHIDRYTGPALEHVLLVLVSVSLGFAIAMALALLSHRRRWLVPPITGLTGALYTIPSIAFFFLLLPLTGRGNVTAVIALTAYSLQIIYRNIIIGLANVPEEARESGRGMGMTDSQLLRQVELPLAVPEIIAGLRVATVSTVALATLAVFAGGGGLGSQIIAGSNITFKTGILVAGGFAILIAIFFDALLVLAQRFLVPWRKVRPV